MTSDQATYDAYTGGRILPTGADLLGYRLILSGTLQVDPIAGAIWRSGRRAELLDRSAGYGRVEVSQMPRSLAMAHRLVWAAAHGLIPAGLVVNHRNRRRWDNTIDNLELTDRAGNTRHWQGYGYVAIADRPDAVAIRWLATLDRGIHEDMPIDPYGQDPRSDWRNFC